MLIQKAQNTFSSVLKNITFIAAAAASVCTFFIAAPAKAVVVDYASCIASPLPSQPRFPFQSFRVQPSNGTATGGFDAYFFSVAIGCKLLVEQGGAGVAVLIKGEIIAVVISLVEAGSKPAALALPAGVAPADMPDQALTARAGRPKV